MDVRLREMSDTELIRAAVANPAAFEALFERQAPGLARWVRSQTADGATANDIVAETFAQAWRTRRHFRGQEPHHGEAWLYGIARKLVLQHHRRGYVETAARRRLQMTVEVVHDDGDETVERIDAESRGPELARALAQLPRDQQVAVDARVVRDREYEAIATELRVSTDTVRARVSRGLRQLSFMIRGDEP